MRLKFQFRTGLSTLFHYLVPPDIQDRRRDSTWASASPANATGMRTSAIQARIYMRDSRNLLRGEGTIINKTAIVHYTSKRETVLDYSHKPN